MICESFRNWSLVGPTLRSRIRYLLDPAGSVCYPRNTRPGLAFYAVPQLTREKSLLICFFVAVTLVAMHPLPRPTFLTPQSIGEEAEMMTPYEFMPDTHKLGTSLNAEGLARAAGNAVYHFPVSP